MPRSKYPRFYLPKSWNRRTFAAVGQVSHTTEQLPSGSYSLELISIGVSYLGDFDVE